MILFLLFLLAMIGYLVYWRNILIPRNNDMLFPLLAKRKNLFFLENVTVDFLKNGGDTNNGNFKMLIHENAIILLRRDHHHFSHSYILVGKGFKDERLSKHFIYYGTIKKTKLNYSSLEITFRQTSKSIFNEFSRTDTKDTVLSIDLGANAGAIKEILTLAKID